MGIKPSASSEHLDFLSDAEILIRTPFPSWIGFTQYLLLALLAFTVGWAAVGKLDIVVAASGRLVTSPAALVVQPLETGLVRSIEVTVGQRVRQGQNLATLDATFAAADLSQLSSKHASLRWQAWRLQALLVEGGAGAGQDSDPADANARLQQMILEQQRTFYRAQMTERDMTLLRLKDQALHARAAVAVLQERLRTLGEIVHIHEDLKTSEGGSRYKLLASRDAYQGVAVDLQREANQTADLERQIAVREAERDSWVQDWRQKLLTELQLVQREFDETTRQLEKAQRRAHLIALTAPADAIVLELAPRPVGAVVKEAEPLITLVPLDTPLTAEVEIPDREIGYVHAGQKARIKIDAFPFQQHGTLPAVIDTVSADAFVKERQGLTVYRARLSLESLELDNMKPDSRLLPGSTLQAEIVVGERSVLSYLIYPLLKGLDEGLHEP